MFRFGSRFGASASRWGRKMSSAPDVEEKIIKASMFTKTKNFFTDNRQALINTIAMAYVVYYALYNTHVKKAWDAREEEVALIQAELDGYKENLIDEKWLAEVDTRVKNGSTTRAELGKRFHNLFLGDTTKFSSREQSSEGGDNKGSGML
jgi:hypothetical protein